MVVKIEINYENKGITFQKMCQPIFEEVGI